MSSPSPEPSQLVDQTDSVSQELEDITQDATQNLASISSMPIPLTSAAEGLPSKNRREKKQSVVIEREPGKSLLPFSRVQKIIKAHKVGCNFSSMLSYIVL